MSPMSQAADRAAEWVYRGVWGVLSSWFHVPQHAPVLPGAAGETIRSFKPSREYLRYRKLFFWIGLVLIDVVLTIAYIAIFVMHPVAGAVLLPVYLVVAIVPDIVAYVAIHLRYDSTWYVLSERSMRLRRGIWIIHETTITYENIQNIEVNQGPIERHFGIATLAVHTAGGGSSAPGKGGHGGGGMLGAHVGVIEGIVNARELRDELMARVERSRSAGLGDDRAGHASHAPGPSGIHLGPAHVAVLEEIRDLLRLPEPGSTGAARP